MDSKIIRNLVPNNPCLVHYCSRRIVGNAINISRVVIKGDSGKGNNQIICGSIEYEENLGCNVFTCRNTSERFAAPHGQGVCKTDFLINLYNFINKYEHTSGKK